MKKWLLSLILLVFPSVAFVLADTVTCESENGRLKECTMNTRGTVRIVKQISSTRCIEGVNWGINRNSVWVNDGCRAVFESTGKDAGSGSGSSQYLPTQVTCESKDGKPMECAMNTRGIVRVVKQISNTRCVEGANWGRNRESIWVKDGCRAVFESTGGNEGSGYGNNPPPAANLPSQVTCESDSSRPKECAMNTRGVVSVDRQISNTRCVEGVNWGVNRNSIWVKDGCRAVFKSTGSSGGIFPPTGQLPSKVICESEKDRRKECAMDTSGAVRVVRQISNTRCVQGVNWGFNRNSIWVDDGCRAEFESTGGGSSNNSSGRPPDSAVRACNGVQDRHGEIVSYSPLRPGSWEIILRYNDGHYVCNVGRDGRVTYFEKLRR